MPQRNHCHIKSSKSPTSPTSKSKLIAFIPTIAILLQLTCHPLTLEVEALECACNTCDEGFCITSPDKHSMCQKSVKIEKNENGTLERIVELGCISAGPESLAEMQCMSYAEFSVPTHVACCKDRDRCNEYLDDPADPKFNIINDTVERPQQPIDMKSMRIDALFLAYIALIIFSTTIILVLCYRCLRNCCMGSTEKKEMLKNESVSSFQSKEDYSRFHRDFAGGSSSTHSYSISDSTKKMDLHDSEHTCLTLGSDPTSGKGLRQLQSRTIAKSVALGQTFPVGEGRFGRVYKGEFHGEDVAVKAFSSIDWESWDRECKVLKRLGSHPNIVRILTSEITPTDQSSTEYCIILEYCSFGSLCDYLDHHDIESSIDALLILQCIINGLNYLHEDYSQLGTAEYKPSIAHRDIKSKNILMRSKNVCCIADFGHALIRVNEHQLDHGKYQTLQVGTVRYMAPEILKPDPRINYGNFATYAQADVYQFALVMWEICYKTTLDTCLADEHLLPYDGVVPHNPKIGDMIKIICEDNYRPPQPESWNSYEIMRQLYELMCDCWRANPNARAPALNVKKKINNQLAQFRPKSPCKSKPFDLTSSFDSGRGSSSNSRSSSTRHSSRDKTRSIA